MLSCLHEPRQFSRDIRRCLVRGVNHRQSQRAIPPRIGVRFCELLSVISWT